MPRNIKKNMAPKPKSKFPLEKIESKVYDTINKDNSVLEPKSPFTLGSNRGNDMYSALTAKGLISPTHIEEKKDAAEKQYDKNVAEGRTNPDKGASNRDVANLATVSQKEMDVGKVRAGLSEKAKQQKKDDITEMDMYQAKSKEYKKR